MENVCTLNIEPYSLDHAKDYDTYFDAQCFIMCLDMLLREEGVFRSICDFIVAIKALDTDEFTQKEIGKIKDTMQT